MGRRDEVSKVIGIPRPCEPEEPELSTREKWSNCVAYWESWRWQYNALLFVVVLMQLLQNNWWKQLLSPLPFLRLLVCIVGANLAFTNAHGIDLLIQHSSFRKNWLEYRSWLFFTGTFLACPTAWVFFRFYVLGLFR